MANPCKLFVGNLSYQATNENLFEAFKKFGKINEAAVITDRGTGRSRGFGFVTFENEDDAIKAKSMHETELLGRSLTVRDAETKRSGTSGVGGGGRSYDSYNSSAYGGPGGFGRGDGFGPGLNFGNSAYSAAYNPGSYGNPAYGGAAYSAAGAYGPQAGAYGASAYGNAYGGAGAYGGGAGYGHY